MQLVLRVAAGVIAGYLLICLLFGMYVSQAPDSFDVKAFAQIQAQQSGQKQVVGFTTATTIQAVATTLLDKPGGYLANDVAPPGIWLDNMPAFEEGVVMQLRDIALALRNDWSRSQSQSTEDVDLQEVQGHFQIDTRSWVFPSAEDEYGEAVKHIISYRTRLTDNNAMDAQFYARADNLAEWLSLVQKRLGALTQSLSQSVDKRQLNIDLAGDASAQQSTPTPSEQTLQTSWFERDNVFYEARGQSWALMHLLRAAQVDFADVLTNKNAMVSVENIIRELEPTQDTVWSPMILNGDGFGFVANHSLVMASYLARANAAIIQLQDLLQRG